VSALDSIQLGHVGAGALLAGVGVAATLPSERLRPWWPAAGAAVIVVGTRIAGVAPLLPGRGRLAVATIAVIAAMAWLTRETTIVLRLARAPGWVVPALLVGAAVGVAAAVPDTEAAFRATGGLGVLLILACFALVIHAPVGPPTAWGVAAIAVVWAAGVGAAGRPAALAGTLACYGSLVALPLATRLAARSARFHAVPWPIVLVAPVPLVVAGGRSWGLEESVMQAAIPALLALGALTALFAIIAVAPWPRRRRA
jgi:hypothetical protein